MGSLYDALYGTNVIPGKKVKGYDKERATKVVNYVRDFLDKCFSLEKISWKKITKIQIDEDQLIFFDGSKIFKLINPVQFIGFNGDKKSPKNILLKNNNLHIEIVFNPNSEVGKNDKASISDIILESALSTIVDNEDSVAAVDAEDKVKCYRNWLGLMKGDLKANVEKNGKIC